MKALFLLVFMSCCAANSMTVYFIPGLGVDSRVFSYLDIDSTINQVYLEWPECSETETMESYADKLIEQMDTSNEVAVVGLSLGGMVAVEIAHKCKNVRCILLSSAVCKDELPMRYEIFRYLPLYAWLKDYHLRITGYAMSYFMSFPDDIASLYVEMLTDYKAQQFRRQTEMLLRWERPHCSINVYRIHGAKDPIIPAKNIHTVDFLIEDGSHKMVVTHANQISELLNAFFRKAS